jgi:hypothetical protein
MEVFVKNLFLLVFSLLVSPVAYSSSPTIEGLKNAIREISLENMENDTNRAEIRAQLEALTLQLKAIAPKVTEERIVQYSPGGWQQIWSDEQNMDPPGAPKRDLSQIYQVVNAGGWGFNFGMREVSPNQNVTFALAVVASVSGDQQTTEITKAYMNPRGLVAGESLIDMANTIHNGSNQEFQERNAGRFPKGPIGAKGVLQLHFIDEELKIGMSPNVYNGKIELFVMERTETVKDDK